MAYILLLGNLVTYNLLALAFCIIGFETMNMPCTNSIGEIRFISEMIVGFGYHRKNEDAMSLM